MKRGRTPNSPSSYRALAHHHQQANSPAAMSNPSSLIRFFDVDTNPARPVRPSPLAASIIRDMPLDLVERIRSFPLFQSAPEDFLVAIGNHLKPQVHGPNDHVITEGHDAKAMYWLVRGVVAVTSRDGEAVYAELKPGAFFGEIGVLMNMPRTATIVARSKCLLLVLKKEDLQLVMPKFPEMEKTILEEAQERLNLLKKRKRQDGGRAATDGATVVSSKKRKSPSPGIIEDPAAGGSAIGSGLVNVRKTLKELPLFSKLPPEILHFLGLSVQPKTFPPFTDIIQQGCAGNDIYFIVQGEAEVIHEQPSRERQNKTLQQQEEVTGSVQSCPPRLRPGQYFGEVASLRLSPGRTATVRSITAVECLMVPGDALDELWRRCPPDIKLQVEQTAKMRYEDRQRRDGGQDTEMMDAGGRETKTPTSRSDQPPTPTPPGIDTLSNSLLYTQPLRPESSPGKSDSDMMEPKDPDPFLSVDMENLRNRRRHSLAPPATSQVEGSTTTSSRKHTIQSPVTETAAADKFGLGQPPFPDSGDVRVKRAKTDARRLAALSQTETALPSDILVRIFKQLDVGELIRLRLVSKRWRDLLTTSPDVCNEVDLSHYNRRVNDEVIVGVLAPFIGTRAVTMDLNNCFHITDEGFSALWRTCGRHVRQWRMRSVWDVSANQILEMSEHAKGLEEVDWSNCRKVGDNLLGRVVGWVVPESPTSTMKNAVVNPLGVAGGQSKDRKPQKQHHASRSKGRQQVAALAPGTVIGCPRLNKLNLSYCKHITDRSMAHLAAHASRRLQSLSLTRCTSITDAGFQSWATYRFEKLTHLCLADCTYLSDKAIVALVDAAKNLTHLDLSFCCALSDTSTEVVALGLPKLRQLRLAFCGSAVGDASLESIALHVNELEGLSVRGCVRVTGRGLESILGGCTQLEWVDVSQCRNLEGWLRAGNRARWGFDDRSAKPTIPTDGRSNAMNGGVGMGEMVPETVSMAMLTTPSFAGFLGRQARRPVRFITEKGVEGLR